MSIAYAIKTLDEVRVREWFKGVDERLRSRKGILIEGAARHLGEGLYAISVEPVGGMFGFLVGPLMIMLCGVGAWVMGGSVGWSNWLMGVGCLMVGLIYLVVAPGVHRVLVRITLWRLLGRRVAVHKASQEVLRRLAHGKI